MNELYDQFLKALKSSRSAELLTREEINQLGEALKDANNEQLKQAMAAIKKNNAYREEADQEAAQEDQKLTTQLKQQIKRVKRAEMDFKEGIEKKTTDSEAEALIKSID